MKGDKNIQCYVKRKYSDVKGARTFFSSGSRSKKRRIPDRLVQRCGLLKELFDQTEVVKQKVPIAFSMEQVKSWLLCADLDVAELAKEDDETLLGAFQVSSTVPYRSSNSQPYASH